MKWQKGIDLKGGIGEKGDTYILSENDKKDIAKKIIAPIVEKTVIEKTEVVKEVISPLVEKRITSVEAIINNLPIVDLQPLQQNINQLQKNLKETRDMAAINAVPVTTSFFNGLRAKNLTIAGGVATQSGDTVTVTVSGGGSPSIGGTITGGTDTAVLFVHPNNVIAQDVNNFSFQDNATTPQALATNTNVALNVNTGGDTTGTDAVNIYAQYDAYLPNSLITNSLTGLNTDGAVPGFTTSSSRGTGPSPSQLQANDMVGGYFGFGAQGASSPTYQNLGGMAVLTTGASANNLGGQLNWYTKADGGSLVNNVSLNSNGQLVQHSVAAQNGIALYNTVDEVTNFERFRISYQGNVAEIRSDAGGTGTSRLLRLMQGSASSVAVDVNANAASTTGFLSVNRGTSGTNVNHFATTGITTASSGRNAFVTAQNTVNQSSTAAYTAFLANITETGVGSGPNYLIDLQVGSVSKFKVDNTGNTTLIGNLTLSGNQSANSWTTSGIQLSVAAATLNDATSTGTVTTEAANAIGIPTITATSATTFTNYATLYIAGAPVNSTNATITNKYSLFIAGGTVEMVGALGIGGVTALRGGFSSQSNGSSNANIFAAAGSGLSSGLTNSQLLFAGASTIMTRVLLGGNTTGTLGASNSYASFIVGSSPVTTPATGTNTLLANVVINPLGTITQGAASVTNTASLYIENAATATVTGANYAFYVNSGDSLLKGNLTLGTAGNKLNITSGSNASIGQATLVGGTVTVNTTAVTASSLIFLTDATTGALTNVGSLTVGTIVAGTSFVINSTNVLDTSKANWLIIN